MGYLTTNNSNEKDTPPTFKPYITIGYKTTAYAGLTWGHHRDDDTMRQI